MNLYQREKRAGTLNPSLPTDARRYWWEEVFIKDSRILTMYRDWQEIGWRYEPLGL